MQQLAFLLYGAFSLVYWILAIFIVYHIRKYLLNKVHANIIALIFFAGMVVFFSLNLMFFLSIPFETASSSIWTTR